MSTYCIQSVTYITVNKQTISHCGRVKYAVSKTVLYGTVCNQYCTVQYVVGAVRYSKESVQYGTLCSQYSTVQ